MLVELIYILAGLVTGFGTTWVFHKHKEKGNQQIVKNLKDELIPYLEYVCTAYQQSTGYFNIQYKLPAMKQDAWHDQFLIEKIFFDDRFL